VDFDGALAAVVAEHGRGLKKAYDDVALLRADVVEVLSESGLLRRTDGGFEVHAAAARYAARTSYAEGLF